MGKKRSTTITLTPINIGNNRVCIVQLQMRNTDSFIGADAFTLSARLIGNPMLNVVRFLSNIKKATLSRPLEIVGGFEILGQRCQLIATPTDMRRRKTLTRKRRH